MSGETPEQGAPGPARESGTEEVEVRRSPRIFNFLLLGAIVGAIAALVGTLLFPENREFSSGQVFGFLVLIGLALGTGLGGVAALIADRMLARRTRMVTAERRREIDDEDESPEAEQMPPASPAP